MTSKIITYAYIHDRYGYLLFYRIKLKVTKWKISPWT